MNEKLGEFFFVNLTELSTMMIIRINGRTVVHDLWGYLIPNGLFICASQRFDLTSRACSSDQSAGALTPAEFEDRKRVKCRNSDLFIKINRQLD